MEKLVVQGHDPKGRRASWSFSYTLRWVDAPKKLLEISVITKYNLKATDNLPDDNRLMT